MAATTSAVMLMVCRAVQSNTNTTVLSDRLLTGHPSPTTAHTYGTDIDIEIDTDMDMDMDMDMDIDKDAHT
jgi:hypothetical protein